MFVNFFASFCGVVKQIGQISFFFFRKKTGNFKKYPVCECDGRGLRQQMNICVRLIQYVQVNSAKINNLVARVLVGDL